MELCQVVIAAGSGGSGGSEVSWRWLGLQCGGLHHLPLEFARPSEVAACTPTASHHNARSIRQRQPPWQTVIIRVKAQQAPVRARSMRARQRMRARAARDYTECNCKVAVSVQQVTA